MTTNAAAPTETAPASTIPASIAAQVAEFNTGFEAQIGPDLSAVFAAEQAALTTDGIPASTVAVGDTVPDARLLTPGGDTTTLAESLDGTPAVLVFYRGAWCPYCNITLQTYQRDLLPALRERGVRLIAISPQTPDGSKAITESAELDFPVLSDASNVLVRQLGIVTEPTADARAAHTALGFDVADSNADATGDIPFPTVLVIDAGRVVSFADIHVDYTTRTEVAAILDAVDALTL
ncbi:MULTISPECIES: peroxiredoxin-like family protein [Subtercola]|uniref:thioredoxin-dependent peroxiredoxin n=1 Tax=Subtercola vilae TaxID=2056433 RepID=A0A4T2CE49_9MICO|nr:MULTISPECIES: peroxiredoxin-like family protein [Subtercola]MEA9985412.1 peroxiredoxin-like family protein [Subtercola sp. RTI3]TIH40846.1 AhpC/TSA family protein [Subtercola vilae]